MYKNHELNIQQGLTKNYLHHHIVWSFLYTYYTLENYCLMININFQI